jgi:hypothetical protein
MNEHPRPRPKHVPTQPAQPELVITFFYHPKTRRIHVTGIVTPSPAVASDEDTDLQINVTLNGAALPMLDCGPPPGQSVNFACNPGDTYSITQTDVNAVGDSPVSDPLTGTVPVIIPPPTNVPQKPGVPTITFTNP